MTGDGFAERWPELSADASTIGGRYEERGWTVCVCEPTDCGIDPGELPGVTATIPPEQFERVDDAVGTGPFGTSHVYRTDDDGGRQFLIAVEARTQEFAVVVPVAVDRQDLEVLESAVDEQGSIHTHLEPPAGDRRVTVSHADLALFLD